MTNVQDGREGRDLIARYAAVRAATDALAAPLSAEDQQLQSMASCSPTKWHRAHTTWFFEEFILLPRGHAPHEPAYRFLFNSYYEAVGPRHPRPQRGLLSRPSCDAVAIYRRAIDGRMHELLDGLDPRSLEELRPLLELGLAHEEQHQELLLTDILHALSQNVLLPAYRSGAGTVPRSRESLGPAGFVEHGFVEHGFVEHEGGLCEIGNDGAAGFSFDSEGPRHRVWVEPFAIATRPISVAEVRAFIDAGGYGEPSLWLAEGFECVREQCITAPLHTRKEGDRLLGFTLDGEIELDDAAPAAHLSFYEADAMARFLGGRLPTEAEWEIVAAQSSTHEANFRETGALRPLPAKGPVPVKGALPEKGGAEVGQLFGDVWEWTASAYQAYPGFAPAAGAVGEYNGKFMVNQQVLRGGSCLTPEGHVRATYRNFWHPDTRFQMSGARVVRAPSAPRSTR